MRERSGRPRAVGTTTPSGGGSEGASDASARADKMKFQARPATHTYGTCSSSGTAENCTNCVGSQNARLRFMRGPKSLRARALVCSRVSPRIAPVVAKKRG
eukprot:1155687-Pleurochrysis_carterae.AAC.2